MPTNPVRPPVPFDYHLHTNFSCDSPAPLVEMCAAALRKGLPEVAFTEHFDLQPEDMCTGFYKPQAYFEALQAARAEFGPQGLTVRAGVEVGEMHLYREQIQPVLDAYPYDVVIGSLHWTQGEIVFEPAYFQKYPAAEVAAMYFTEMAEMVQAGGFDVLGHLDVFKRVGYEVYGRFDINEWKHLVCPVWEACIANEIAPEINTSGLYKAVAETHPGLDAIRWYREMGGERLVIGSDGHRPDQLGMGLETAVEIARAAGFSHLCRFERRQVVERVEIGE